MARTAQAAVRWVHKRHASLCKGVLLEQLSPSPSAAGRRRLGPDCHAHIVHPLVDFKIVWALVVAVDPIHLLEALVVVNDVDLVIAVVGSEVRDVGKERQPGASLN